MLFGAYATQVWWPAWSPTRPRSARIVKTKVNARILPVFGDLPLNQVDTEQISRWTHTLAADGLSPSSIRTYRVLLGLILNAAVTNGYLPHAPTLPAPPIGRPARSSEVWLTRVQLDQLADAIEPRDRALVLTAAHTGARWSELLALRWEDFRPDLPLDDGAIAGPGRLKLRRPATSPTGREPESSDSSLRRVSKGSGPTLTGPALGDRLGDWCGSRWVITTTFMLVDRADRDSSRPRTAAALPG